MSGSGTRTPERLGSGDVEAVRQARLLGRACLSGAGIVVATWVGGVVGAVLTGSSNVMVELTLVVLATSFLLAATGVIVRLLASVHVMLAEALTSGDRGELRRR